MLVLGVGGLGVLVGFYLVVVGVGYLCFVDYDCVECSNLYW